MTFSRVSNFLRTSLQKILLSPPLFDYFKIKNMARSHQFKSIIKRLEEDFSRHARSSQRLTSLNEQRLLALYQASQKLNTIIDPEQLFREVIKLISELLKAERVVILLLEEGDLKIKIASNIDDQSERNALHFSRSIVNTVMHDYRPIFSTNALQDNRFSQFQTIQKLEILSLICVPILLGNRAIGTIYVDNRHLTNIFTEEDVNFLQAFANLLGIAIRNALAYKEIEQLNRSLEEKVEQRTAELRRTIRELKETQEKWIQSEKMASLGRLIAGFMHEFNNPINFIYSNIPHLEEYTRRLVEALQEALPLLPKEEQERLKNEKDLQFILTDFEKLIAGIREGAQRSRQIIEDLKNFSPSKLLQQESIDWNSNLQQLVQAFQDNLKRSLTIELDFQENFRIRGSRVEINHALMQLLKNAEQAGAQTIRIESNREKDWLVCRISDDGRGIPPEIRKHIFDPFFTTKEVGEGMGIGLSLVYSTVKHHQGDIEVSSQPGQGTTFVIKLPLENSKNSASTGTKS